MKGLPCMYVALLCKALKAFQLCCGTRSGSSWIRILLGLLHPDLYIIYRSRSSNFQSHICFSFEGLSSLKKKQKISKEVRQIFCVSKRFETGSRSTSIWISILLALLDPDPYIVKALDPDLYIVNTLDLDPYIV